MTATIGDLALHCILWSLLALGGNAAVLSAIQHYTVDVRHWLTGAQFVAFFALSQAAPGPNGMALVLIGQKAAGLLGALTALIATVVLSSILAYHGGAYLDRHGDVPWVKSIRQGFAPITVGLVLSGSFVLARTTDVSWPRLILTVISAIIIFRTKANPLWLIGLGAAFGLLSGIGHMRIF
ncbi:chromate transporter [Acidocella sp.]|jgi:chromate transporter|uniref:chromate transporter n=1 Tax=Acidocella sp. TaxID=50710 RepID=UPI002F40A987